MSSYPTSNTEKQYCQVTRQQFPLHCPMSETTLWSSHPRVFLPIEETRHAICPYCGTHYTLKDD